MTDRTGTLSPADLQPALAHHGSAAAAPAGRLKQPSFADSGRAIDRAVAVSAFGQARGSAYISLKEHVDRDRGVLAPRMATIDEIIENFDLLDEWDDRYRYVIELGRTLPPLPEAEHNDANKVRGCASQVWLVDRRCSRTAPAARCSTFAATATRISCAV